MRNLKVTHLVLISKYFHPTLKIFVEQWKGETDNDYFFVDLAFDEGSCASLGSISDRESTLGDHKEILWSKDELFDIFDLACYLKWDTSTAILEDVTESPT